MKPVVAFVAWKIEVNHSSFVLLSFCWCTWWHIEIYLDILCCSFAISHAFICFRCNIKCVRGWWWEGVDNETSNELIADFYFLTYVQLLSAKIFIDDHLFIRQIHMAESSEKLVKFSKHQNIFNNIKVCLR